MVDPTGRVIDPGARAAGIMISEWYLRVQRREGQNVGCQLCQPRMEQGPSPDEPAKRPNG